MMQQAYARRLWAANGKSKKDIALAVGYSEEVANSTLKHIEEAPGFQKAMTKLAQESNSLALAALEQFKLRGLDDFSNKDLVSALNAITKAWSQFSAPVTKAAPPPSANNKLRTVILQQIENQQNIVSAPKEEEGAKNNKSDLDF